VSAITELAERLGKAIADSPATAKLRAARQELHKDAEATRLLEEYRKQIEKIAQLQQDGKPIEPEDKHKMDDLRGKLMSNATFKTFTAAQVDYVDLMRQVNQAIQKHIADVEIPPAAPKTAPGAN